MTHTTVITLPARGVVILASLMPSIALLGYAFTIFSSFSISICFTACAQINTRHLKEQTGQVFQ